MKIYSLLFQMTLVSIASLVVPATSGYNHTVLPQKFIDYG